METVSNKAKGILKKKKLAKVIKNQTRNSKRRTQRKQTNLKYYKNLKATRQRKTTEDLCSHVKFVNIRDMDWLSDKTVKTVPAELIEWHKRDQLAYWKSKALTLELENKVLRQHLQDMYSQTIIDDQNNHQGHSNNNKNKKKEKKYQQEEAEEVVANVPDPDIKNRLEDMRQVYGDQAEKIMGMETAIQLNYERHLEQDQPVFWPVIPIRMTFK